MNGLAPEYLSKYFVKRSAIHGRNTRGSGSLDIPRCRLSTGQRAFFISGESANGTVLLQISKMLKILIVLSEAFLRNFLIKILE
jgi:hypothetical protein